MVLGVVFTVYVVLHLLMFGYGFVKTHKFSWRGLFLAVLLLGLIYDNSILALGNYLVSTDYFVSVSLPRFILHATILPFLILYSFSCMKGANVPISQHKISLAIAFVLTGIALIYGIWVEILGLELIAIETYGHWRMTHAHGGAPIATIASNALAIVAGMFVWRTSRIAWLFIGSLVIFVMNMVAAGHEWVFLTSNLAEVIFVFFLVQNEMALTKYAAQK